MWTGKGGREWRRKVREDVGTEGGVDGGKEEKGGSDRWRRDEERKGRT